MSEYVVTDTELIAVANAIRTKGGTSADLEWNADFISAINAISGGGSDGSFVNPKHVDVNIDSMFNSILANYPQFNGFTALGGGEKRNWWGANNASQHWLSVTFEEAECIDKIEFSNAFKEGASQWQSTEVIFQGSNDNSNWTDLLTLTNLTPSETPEIYNVNNNDKYLYYRFLCTSGSTFYTGLGKIRLYGKGEGGASNYELLDYIQSDGTQTIDLGVKCLSGEIVGVKCLPNSGISGYRWAFGASYSANSKMGLQFDVPTGVVKWHYGTGSNNRGTIDYSVPSVLCANTIASDTANNVHALSINAEDATSANRFIGKLYYVTIGDNVFLPCRRKSDGVCGLWDSTNSQFLTDSAGGNALVAGNVIYDS